MQAGLEGAARGGSLDGGSSGGGSSGGGSASGGGSGPASAGAASALSAASATAALLEGGASAIDRVVDELLGGDGGGTSSEGTQSTAGGSFEQPVLDLIEQGDDEDHPIELSDDDE